MTMQWAGRAQIRDLSDERSHTYSGLPIKAHYGPTDLPSDRTDELASPPGTYPYLRGVFPEGYRSRMWTFRQYAGFGGGDDSNAWFKSLMRHGQKGLSVALDLPTQMGLDSDHDMAYHEVGRVGVAIDTLADMEAMFDGIPLGDITSSFTINATANIILAMYLVTAEKQGVPYDQVRGTVQNDILKEIVARGAYIFGPRPSLRLAGDIIEHCITHAPKFNPISVSAGHMKSAGATPVQSDAYMFANAMTYIDELVRRGYSIDDFGHQLSFLTGSYRDFFESAARIRACRRLWARLTKERYGAEAPKTMQFRVHVAGDTDAMTSERPMNNVARIALYILSNALGGAQSMQVPCFDEAYEIPSEEAIQNALDVQQIVAYETKIADVVDPLAGSYFIESLTADIEAEMWRVIDEIGATGGSLAWVEDGRLAQAISQEAYLWEKRIKDGREVIVGHNFAQSEDTGRESYEDTMFHADHGVVDAQIKRLAEVRAGRDQRAVDEALRELGAVAAEGRNHMEPLMQAVRSYASVGEIVQVLKGVFGEFHAPAGV